MRFWLAASLLALTVGFVGCEAKSDKKAATDMKASSGEMAHDEHAHAAPADLKTAIQQAIDATQKIKDAAEAGKIDDVHDTALHEIGHTLEAIPALVKASSLDDAQKAALETSSKELFAVVSGIDETVHDGKEVKYDDVKAGLEKGLNEMKSFSEIVAK